MANKNVAAYSLFKALYDSNSDIYSVIKQFVNYVLQTRNYTTFQVTEISIDLKTIFGFSIPDSVIKTSVKRFQFANANGWYQVDKSKLSEIPIFFNNINSEYDRIFDFFYNCVHQSDNSASKDIVASSLFSFLIDSKTSDKYCDIIAECIISNQTNTDFINQLNNIKEGTLLYTGITHSLDLSTIGTWKNDLTIFLDMEIIFHYIGYNGLLYKQLFDDFFLLVKEINSIKKYIKLRYFAETEDKINQFFKTAEILVEKGNRFSAHSTAMESILKDTQNRSDIAIKQSDFWSKLKGSGIIVDENSNYYSQNNDRFNTVFIEKEDAEQNKVAYCNHLLHHVNVLRKGNNKYNFENSKYILVTGNSLLNEFAWNEQMKSSNDTALTTNLDYITNLFWFKLNKGFGKNVPMNANVISRSQLVIASILNKKITPIFDQTIQEYDNKKISEEQLNDRIISLRKFNVMPEDITNANITELSTFIDDSQIEKYSREKSLIEQDVKEKYKEIKSLREEKIILENENEEQRKKGEDLLNENELLQKEIKEQRKKEEEKLKKKTDKKRQQKKYFKIACLILISLILVLLLLYFWSSINVYLQITLVIFDVVLVLWGFFGKTIKQWLNK